MLNYIVRRFLYSVPVLVLASFVVFVAVRLTFDPTVKFRQLKDQGAFLRAKK